MACVCHCGRPVDCGELECPLCSIHGGDYELDYQFERAVSKFGEGLHTEDA